MAANPYIIDQPRRLVTVKLSGTVHGTLVAATFEAIYRDPAAGPGFDILWDGSAITRLLFERGDLASFVRLSKEFSDIASSGRDIILVERSLDAAMAHMYAVMMRAQQRAVHVCSSITDVNQVLAASKV
jgi:hypothetical protein